MQIRSKRCGLLINRVDTDPQGPHVIQTVCVCALADRQLANSGWLTCDIGWLT